MEKREKFASRLGFILISAGCAIGLGDVWRFPYIAGQYGGGIFVLIYLVFIFLLGLPIITMELAVGRASQKSIATSFNVLQKKGQKWHWMGYAGIVGNYLLMMFYTTIAGWMLAYFYKFLIGQFAGLDAGKVGQVFTDLIANPLEMSLWMVITTVFCFGICSLGLQDGVEKVTKFLMVALLALGQLGYGAVFFNLNLLMMFIFPAICLKRILMVYILLNSATCCLTLVRILIVAS